MENFIYCTVLSLALTFYQWIISQSVEIFFSNRRVLRFFSVRTFSIFPVPFFDRKYLYHQDKSNTHIFDKNYQKYLLYIKIGVASDKTPEELLKDPWGAPQSEAPASEKVSSIDTKNFLLVRSDSNHLITDVLKPRHDTFMRRISWSRLLNTFWRCISIMPVCSLLSIPDKKKSVFCSRQKSFEKFDLKLDWY